MLSWFILYNRINWYLDKLNTPNKCTFVNYWTCRWDRDQHYKHKSITACNTVIFLLGAVVAVIAWWLDLQLPMQSVPITTLLWVRILIRARCTPLCDKVCQRLATGLWFSLGSPVSSTNKTDCHNITEILLKVALNIIKQTNKQYFH
jgi:hypothetical protein